MTIVNYTSIFRNMLTIIFIMMMTLITEHDNKPLRPVELDINCAGLGLVGVALADSTGQCRTPRPLRTVDIIVVFLVVYVTSSEVVVSLAYFTYGRVPVTGPAPSHAPGSSHFVIWVGRRQREVNKRDVDLLSRLRLQFPRAARCATLCAHGRGLVCGEARLC